MFRDEAYQVRAVGEQGRIRHPLDKLWLVWRAITKAASLAHSIKTPCHAVALTPLIWMRAMVIVAWERQGVQSFLP